VATGFGGWLAHLGVAGLWGWISAARFETRSSAGSRRFGVLSCLTGRHGHFCDGCLAACPSDNPAAARIVEVVGL